LTRHKNTPRPPNSAGGQSTDKVVDLDDPSTQRAVRSAEQKRQAAARPAEEDELAGEEF
jgi:hypothetical protein